MVYKLDKADQLCDVIYIDWSKKYSPIPKATCEMLETQCEDNITVNIDCGKKEEAEEETQPVQPTPQPVTTGADRDEL